MPITTIDLTREEIADRARQLWQIAGSPAGRDEEFWLGAEAELRKNRPIPGQVTPPVIAPPPGRATAKGRRPAK